MKIIDADALPRHGRRGGLVYWKDIENAPTVDAVPVKHAHLVRVVDNRGVHFECPHCGARIG